MALVDVNTVFASRRTCGLRISLAPGKGTALCLCNNFLLTKYLHRLRTLSWWIV